MSLSRWLPLVLLCVASAGPRRHAVPARNLLLITLDTLRADYVGAYVRQGGAGCHANTEHDGAQQAEHTRCHGPERCGMRRCVLRVMLRAAMHVVPVPNGLSADPRLETFPDGIENSIGNFSENRVCARAGRLVPMGHIHLQGLTYFRECHDPGSSLKCSFAIRRSHGNSAIPS